MFNWKVVKPKPRYEDLMDDMFSKLAYRNITPSPQELNHLDLPNPFMFGSTDDDGNIAQAVDEFDDFSTPPSADLLKKMRLDASQSSHPPVKKQKIVEESKKVSSRVAKSKKRSDKLSKDKKILGPSIDRVFLDKNKDVPNVKMRGADKASAASEEKTSLSKSDLDEIKSYVSTYVAQYSVHESEKGYPDIEEDPPQSVNEHTTNAKSYNIVNVAGQSSRLGGNEGASKESLKEAESLYTDKLKEDGRHNTDVEVNEAINKERVTVPVCNTNLTYVRKNPSRRNRQPSKVCQSPFVSVFNSRSKEKEVIQSNKKLKYPFEGQDINGPHAEDLFSKFTNWMSSELYNPHATKEGKDEYYTTKFVDLKPSLDFVVAQPVKKHIDVVFYYLRKKAKLDTTSAYRYTTVNCVFMNYIHHTYTHYHRSHSEIDLILHDEYVRSMKVTSVERSICEIMQGLCILAAISLTRYMCQ
ncbi:hypothetical protein CQW23_19629 [Capsicum baccatum]|uniref:Uncharacterized protein n=1 Tax=Capsicum baccatum TaxID=33114 RepID=A0A2G2W6B8_CAPBA|nr:hypothetical protein CQW23_19629 [Capsicum baccatum]